MFSLLRSDGFWPDEAAGHNDLEVDRIQAWAGQAGRLEPSRLRR